MLVACAGPSNGVEPEPASESALSSADVDVTYGAVKGIWGTEYVVDDRDVFFTSAESEAEDASSFTLSARDLDGKTEARRLWRGEFVRGLTQDAETLYLLTSEDRAMGKRTVWAVPKNGRAPTALVRGLDHPWTQIAAATSEDVLVLGSSLDKVLFVTAKSPGATPREVATIGGEGPVSWSSDGRSVFVNEGRRLSVRSIGALGAPGRVVFESPSDRHVELHSRYAFDAAAESFVAIGKQTTSRGATRVVVERSAGASTVTEMAEAAPGLAEAPKLTPLSVCFELDISRDDIACVSPGSSTPSRVVHVDDPNHRIALGSVRVAGKRVFWTQQSELRSRKLE